VNGKIFLFEGKRKPFGFVNEERGENRALTLHFGPLSRLSAHDCRAIQVTTAARPGFNPGIPPAKNMQGAPTPLSVLGPQAEAETATHTATI